MNDTHWIYDYNQPATPELIDQVFSGRPEVWALPEEWDWYVFQIEQLALRSQPETVKNKILEYLNEAIKMRDLAQKRWAEIRQQAEKETGAPVLATSDFVKGGKSALSRAYVDTIYVTSLRR